MEKENNYESEDEITMSTATENSNWRYQKEIIYNKLLPYASDIESEAQVFLTEIKANLGRAVMMRELIPGCEFWTLRLFRYMRIYGLMFSKKDHILFIKLMYELVTIPNLKPHLTNIFCVVLMKLLKKKELISPDELELPWRPLYDLAYQVKLGGQVTRQLYHCYTPIDTKLGLLIHAAKVYFPLNATQEILDELRPMICPFDYRINNVMTLVQRFLPVNIPPQHYALGHQLWFDEFMRFWELCSNAPKWENEMMCLMAKLASNNIGYINWEPYIPMMFTRFIRCLSLPVSYKNCQGVKQHKMCIVLISLWIVSTLGKGSSTQIYLEKFLKTIETFFHPANFGRWQEKLKELSTKLSYHFIVRLHKERKPKRSWETPIPQEHKLTDSDIDAFVKCLMPVTIRVMFSKLGSYNASQGLQYLATIRPNLVIPEVLERMYSTLDSVTEPNKLIASMLCTAAVARPMVQGSRNMNKGYEYPEGPAQVLTLLFSLLPGIDLNDPRKCVAALRLISVYATLVPFVDSSRSTAEMSEEERMICETTSRFEDFVLQFLDRIFTVIDFSSLEFVRLESDAGDGKSKMEGVFDVMLDGACTSVLVQTSDKIFECALHKLRDFITGRIFETNVAGQLAATICSTFARTNGRDTLRTLLPVLSQTVLDITEEEQTMKGNDLDNRLSHVMLLFSAIVNTQGQFLIPHKSTLFKVLDRVLYLNSREGNDIACKIVNRTLASLTTMKVHKYRHVDRDFNDPDYPYVRDWGQPIKLESFQAEWNMPGENEIALAQEIFLRYLLPELNKLQEYCKNWNSLSREELLQCLKIVNAVIGGCEYLLPVWTEKHLHMLESCVGRPSFLPTLGITGAICMPDGGNVRSYMAGVMNELQKVILKHAEDDTKSLFVLIQIWNCLLLGKMPEPGAHEAKYKNMKGAKAMMTDKLLGNKSHLPIYLLDRLDMQHELRVEFQWFPITETHIQIMLNLFSLATSRYANVRLKAQRILYSGLQYFSYSYKVIIPHLIDVMKKDTEENHEAYKGALYILLGPQKDPIFTVRDWQTLKALWPAFILSKTSEKKSVIRLRDNLLDVVHRCYSTITIEWDVPESCLKVASALWETEPNPSLPQPTVDEIRQGLENMKKIGECNRQCYDSLLDELHHALLEQNLHWRHKQMAMQLLRYLAHPDSKYPPKIVRYFLGALIHDSIDERKIATSVVVVMLTQLKRKQPKVPVDLSTLCGDVELPNGENNKFIMGPRPDNEWLQYDYKSRPLTEEAWNTVRYVHKPYIGYYSWPKQLELYASTNDQSISDNANTEEFIKYQKEVDLFFNDPQNITKLITYFSLEEKKGSDRFCCRRSSLFKILFRNYGITYLKHLLPHLHRLVLDKQESSQRCASEIVAGIASGVKYWPFEMVREMWDILLPIIRLALDNLTAESIVNWTVCFARANMNRDPNKNHWLLECLMEEPRHADAESSFLQCARLYMLQGVLSQYNWRITQLKERLLKRVENRLLTNTFEIVRERLGSVLAAIFSASLRNPNEPQDKLVLEVQEILNKLNPRLQKLIDNNVIIPHKEENSLSMQVANVKLNDEDKPNEDDVEKDREIAIRLLKIICKWIRETIVYAEYAALPNFYQLFPIICQLEHCDSDPELSKICKITIAFLAQAITLPCDIPLVLKAITKTSKSDSWGARATCLQFLQILVFYNMSTLLSNESWVASVENLVLCLLEDERLEVRESAGTVLGGLLHCKFIPDQEKLLEDFKKRAKTKLHKKNRVDGRKPCVNNNNDIDLVRIRHAGVLGLCAFIQAHPYDVPEYVPPLFEHLGLHLNDPQPIPQTIRKTLADFKRTHYDDWLGVNGHAQHFTEEQLAVLQDLTVPPSHYA